MYRDSTGLNRAEFDSISSRSGTVLDRWGCENMPHPASIDYAIQLQNGTGAMVQGHTTASVC